MKKLLLLCATLIVFIHPAEARHRHHHHRTATVAQSCVFFCDQQQSIVRSSAHHRRYRAVESASYQESIVNHPAGCPRIAFCGCGAALRVFGHTVRSLWLAANWYRFPRSAPMPGAAAVRPHHVFVLEQHIQGDVWLVYDANSGGHATRIHARSIAGYTIVNPHA